MPANTFQSERAKRLLVHYLKQATDAAGCRWDADNTAEVDAIIDNIIAASIAGSPSFSSATPSIQSIPSTADPLTRIADALERIADKLDLLCAKGTDYSGADMAVLRIETLR